MPSLDSDRVRAALEGKMLAVRDDRHDQYFFVYDGEGTKVSYTRLSHGRRETLSASRVSQMARQLRLDNAQALVAMVECPLSREEAIEMMKRNPTDASRYRT